MQFDPTPHVYDTNEWYEVEIPFGHVLGSFTNLKFMFLNDTALACRGIKVHMEQETLPTANGYHHLDGREFLFTYKGTPVMRVRTEDCGLGTRKARLFAEQIMQFKIA